MALDLNAPRHFFMMLANLSVERPPAGRLGTAVISVRSRGAPLVIDIIGNADPSQLAGDNGDGTHRRLTGNKQIA